MNYVTTLTNTGFSVSLDKTEVSVSLSRTGAQGSKGNSIDNIYIDNNELKFDIVNSVGDLVETINLGSIKTLLQDAIDEGVSEIVPGGIQNDILVTFNQNTNAVDFTVLSDVASTPNSIVKRGGDGFVAASRLMFDTDINYETTTGDLVWNAEDGTLELGLAGGEVKLQLGQEQVVYAYNNTGSVIDNGKVVYISGSMNDRVTIDLASNNQETSDKIIGVTTEEIASGTSGYVTTQGLVRNVNTSAFSAGDILWVALNGTLTNVQPHAPLHSIAIGYVVTVGSTNGSVFVKVKEGGELDDIHDVHIVDLQDGQVLSWDAANGYWTNDNLDLNFATDAELASAVSTINTALAGKSSIYHTHIMNDLTNVSAAIAGQNWVLAYNTDTDKWESKPLSISMIQNLQSTLDGKQPLSSVLTNTTASYTIAEKSKLSSIEDNATADQTPSEILTGLLGVDGTGSLLDADLLDGQQGAYYLDYTNFTNTPTAVSSFTNDANYVSSGANVSVFTNDANYVVSGANVSTLTNDANYTSTGDNVSVFVNDANYTSTGDNISVFTNDSGYLTSGANVSVFVNDANYTSTGDNISVFTNDSNFVSSGANLSVFTNDTNFVASGANVSVFANDANYTSTGDNISVFTNDSNYATQAYVDSTVSSTVKFKGGYNASTNTPNLDSSPTGILTGDLWIVTVEGDLYTETVHVGDYIYANVDNPSQLSDWTVVHIDITASDVKTLYESNADTNAFTDALLSKLNGVEAGATGDQTAAEIKTAYESNSNTNAFTDAEQTKLAGIEAGATADMTASEILAAIKTVDGSGSGLDADTLDGIGSGSFLRSDANDTASGTINFGPNANGKYLKIGGTGNGGDANTGAIAVSNGNLHIDAANAYTTYLNYYDGTGGVAFGSGTGSAVAWMGPDGDLWKGSADNSGSKYWHAGNDGAGSGLDADLLGGINSSNFFRKDTSNTIIDLGTNKRVLSSWTGSGDSRWYLAPRLNDDSDWYWDAEFGWNLTQDYWYVDSDFYVGGNITVGGTVDGRDIAADGTKLDGIEAGATADQTKADIDALNIDADTLDGYETSAFGNRWGVIPVVGNDGVMEVGKFIDFHESDTDTSDNSVRLWSNSGVLTTNGSLYVSGNIDLTGTVDGRDLSVDGVKLDGIEAGATADQTGAEIKTALFAEADTNNLTDTLLTKLNGIEASADVTDAGNVNPLIDSHLNVTSAGSGQYLGWNGTDYAWSTVSGYTDTDVDTHLNTSTATTGQILSWNGTDYDWVADAGGATEINGLSDGYFDGSSLGLGINALANDDGSSNNNVAVGVNAMLVNSTGSSNTALGVSALFSNSNGNYNTAAGFYALHNNTSGGENTAYGRLGLFNNTSGSTNTASGGGSLYNNTTGNGNSAFGLDALYYNTTASRNSALGEYALRGNSVAKITGSFNAGIGYQTGYNLSTGQYNLLGGYQAGYNLTTGYYNVALGDRSGYSITSGTNNTLVGKQSGYNLTSGNNNLVAGASAGYNLTTGGDSALLGLYAGYNATSASGVVAIGSYAAQYTTTSQLATHIGYNAGQYYTTAWSAVSVGARSSQYQTGANNTSVGTNALQGEVGLSTGTNNTAVGYSAGSTVRSGGNNLILGAGAQPSTATVSNEITLGNGSISAFRIPGLNISAASNSVTINGWTITESAGSLYFSTGGSNKMKLDSSGNLQVVGSVESNATIS